MHERDYGPVFLPRSNLDVDMYDDNEIVAGYRVGTALKPLPGTDRSPAHR